MLATRANKQKLVVLWDNAKAGGAFSPLDIAGLVAWFDFSDISTLYQDSGKTTPVTADGDPIGAVEDKSGNGNDATQATTANKPTYKTGIQNGLSVARFDGVNDYLGGTGTGFSGDQAQTVLVVAYENTYGAGSNNNCIVSFGSRSAETDRRIVLYSLENSSQDAVRLYGGNTIFSNSVYHTWRQYSWGYAADGGEFSHWRNGVSISSTSSSTGALNITSGNFRVGDSVPNVGSHYLDGDIGEILVYNTFLSSADRGNSETYQLTKWGLP